MTVRPRRWHRPHASRRNIHREILCPRRRGLDGRAGSFNFAHSATTSGSDRAAEFFVIVPTSGTGDLGGITGGGGLQIDADGTHRVWFDYGRG